MSALIDDALTIAKSGATLDKRDRIDLAADIVDHADDRISFAQPSRHAPFSVAGDRIALRRSFDNLIENALAPPASVSKARLNAWW